MTMELGVGVIGCGGIAVSAHLPAYSAIPGARLIAVSDIDESRAVEAAKKFGAKAYYVDYHQLLEREDVDVVDICVPPNLHKEVILASAARSKHVFCEKPLCLSLADTDEVIKVMESKGLKLGVDFHFRFHSFYIRIKQMIDDGTIGSPTVLWLNNVVSIPSAGFWFWDKNVSGGMLIEHTCHFFDLFRWWAGDPEGVFGEEKSVVSPFYMKDPQRVIEDLVVATIKYRNGALGSILQTHTPWPLDTRVGVIGENGSAETSGGWMPSKLTLTLKDQVPQVIQAMPRPETFRLPYKASISAFLESIRQGKEPPVTGYDARAALELALAIHKSARENRFINLPLCEE
jgi:predicted dehydrogenase